MAHEPGNNQPKLPAAVFGVSEIRRLKRELEALEDYLRQANIRGSGKQAPMPRVSRALEALAAENNAQLLKADHRQRLKKFLEILEQHAPVIHMSFAVDPSGVFTTKIVTWLRTNISPYVLLDVGLQPTIAAGCVVRIASKVFDLSLRNRFADSQKVLIESLESISGKPAVAPDQVIAVPAQEVAVS